MIEIRDLTFQYAPEAAPVLSGIDLTVRPGERIVILGPNGSGKSTLARIMAGLLSPSSGEVRVDDLNPQVSGDLEEIHRLVGLIFQDPDNQILSATVDRELAFGPENLTLSPAEIRTRVDWALERFNLRELADREPATLSGGEKQRLCIASVLTMQPRYLILDEPTSHLDTAGRAALSATLAQLRSEHGIATLEITQFPGEADGADRVIVLEAGRILADGSPGDVRELLAERESFRPYLQPLPSMRGTKPRGEILLSARTLRFAYRGLDGRERSVLAGLDLDLGAGEIVGLRGASGSGKSTLLQVLCGLLTGHTGTVRSEGAVTMTFQFPERSLFEETVQADVRFGPANQGAAREEQDRRALEALRRVGLDPVSFGPRSPFSLSAGEQRRVGLAGVAAFSARVYAFDEPTSGLDPCGVRDFLALVAGLRDQGAAILLSTHDPEVLAAVCDRVVTLNGGLLAAGPDPVPGE